MINEDTYSSLDESTRGLVDSLRDEEYEDIFQSSSLTCVIDILETGRPLRCSIKLPPEYVHRNYVYFDDLRTVFVEDLSNKTGTVCGYKGEIIKCLTHDRI